MRMANRNPTRLGIVAWTVFLACLLCLAPGAAARTKLVVGTWEPIDIWNATYGDQMEPFIQDNPGIDPEVVVIAGHGEFAAKVAVLAATGDLPDVLKIPPEQVAPLVSGGLFDNLETYIARDTSFNNRAWLPGAINAMQFQGIMFGFPAYVVNYTYGYNYEILADQGIQPPGPEEFVNWTQIRDIAKRARQDIDGDGIPEIWGYHHGTGYTEIIPLIFQAGGRVFDEQALLDIDHPTTYEGLNWLLDMTAETIQGGSAGEFWQRKVATRRVGSWEMKNILQADTPVGVAGGIEHRVRTDMAYVTSFAITRGSKAKDEAWRFLKYVTSKEAQQFIPPEGLAPMRRDVTLVEPYRNMLLGFISSVSYSTPYPYHVYSHYVESTVNGTMGAVWNRDKTPEAVIPELQRTINAYLLEQMKSM